MFRNYIIKTHLKNYSNRGSNFDSLTYKGAVCVLFQIGSKVAHSDFFFTYTSKIIIFILLELYNFVIIFNTLTNLT